MKISRTRIQIGSYAFYPVCRFCKSEKVEKVIDLGNIPLAGGFLKKPSKENAIENEKLYPLQINFCTKCYLVQCSISINPDILFKDYFYHSSSIKTLITHFKDKAKEIERFINKKDESMILEIGCNDGEFINAVMKNGYKALGVDPAENITRPLIKRGIPIINDYFTSNLAGVIIKKYGKADAIYSFHSMAHIEDMHDVLQGIKKVLKKNGYLAFEVHYLGDLIKEMQYDMIYHEHQYYYSLLALINFFRMYDMEIFNIEHVKVRAGSMMYYVQNKGEGRRKIDKNVKILEVRERKQRLNKKETYHIFSKRIAHTKKKLLKTVSELKKRNKKIAGYGASGRGTVLMNYCGLSKDLLNYVIDDAPAKQGSFMPGTHQEILPSKNLISDHVDYAILFAWPFLDEVLKRNENYLKNGGKFITPLPKVKILPK